MKLKHPDSNVTVEVPEADADLYLSQGWAETPKPKSDKDSK